MIFLCYIGCLLVQLLSNMGARHVIAVDVVPGLPCHFAHSAYLYDLVFVTSHPHPSFWHSEQPTTKYNNITFFHSPFFESCMPFSISISDKIFHDAFLDFRTP